MVKKWGNSAAVRIPSVLAGQLNVDESTEVEFTVHDCALVVQPVEQKELSLSGLLKNCKPSRLHGVTNFGDDVRREAKL